MTRALLEKSLSAFDALMKWDARRKLILPYSVRDPVHEVQKELLDELAKPPTQSPVGTTEDEARSLAKGLHLTTTRERCFYEDSWTETVVNWRAVADLIDRVRK